MFKKILFPTSFEEFSLPILQSIGCLKRAGLQEVVLLHVVDTGILSTEVDGGLPVTVDTIRKALASSIDMIRETATKHLSSYADYLRSEGIDVKTELVTGKVVPEILRVAAENDVSLIVAGRQKRDVLGEIFVGSTTDRVIRKSKVPVLVAKYHTLRLKGDEVQERFCTDMFRKILFPTDWSSCSERARDYLPLLRSAGTSEVLVVHVIEELSDFADVPMHMRDEARATMTQKSQEELERLTQELEGSGCRVRASILYGEPYREIMRIATEEDVSMILMGSHGRGFVQGILWGNVSQRVVEYSEKPVLVVK
jgi:nucleotide-binding universal stress UspA family protein